MTRRPNKPERPSRSTKQKIESAGDELPMLEPIDDGGAELPVLEPMEEVASEPVFSVKVACGTSDEAGFDTAIAIEVPDLDKKEMPDAVAAPLKHSLDSGKAKVRHHRVLVRFAGDAIIGSAVKERCGQILDAAKARKVVVRRGYGDEVLFEREAPRAKVAVVRDGGSMTVEVDTGELEAVDLSVALQGELVQLAKDTKGMKVQFTFLGTAKPDQSLRNLIHQMLRGAGALRAALGQRVLFDKELEDRVKLEVKGDVAIVTVAPSAVDAETEEALAMKLQALGDQVRGKTVRLVFASKESESIRSATMRYCTAGAPQRVEVLRGASVEVLWPSLLAVDGSGAETVLRVLPNGRDRAAVFLAFASECRDFAPVIRGKKVVVEFAAGTVVDAELEAKCLQPLVEQGAASVASSVESERLPFHPKAITVAADGAVSVVCVHTEVGKPQELLRAFERFHRANQGLLAGAQVRLSFAGEIAPSRSLVRSLVEQFVAARPSRFELEGNGRRDLIVPALLTSSGSPKEGLSLSIALGGRDEEQVQLALLRELAGLGYLGDAEVNVEPSESSDTLIRELIRLSVASVDLGGPSRVRVYPGLFIPERKKGGGAIAFRATPHADPAMTQRMIERELPLYEKDEGSFEGKVVEIAWPAAEPTAEPFATLLRLLIARGVGKVLLDSGSSSTAVQIYPEIPREFVTVLGRKDDAVPPLVMMGIGLDRAGDQKERVLAGLAERSELTAGRRVLLVGRRAGEDVPFDGDDELVVAVRAVVDASSVATLTFAGRDRRGRNYFTVAHSTVEGLAAGAAFADPRPQ